MQGTKKHHYDVICYHSVSKVVYFVEHDIGSQPSMFQCSTVSGSNFMEGGGTPPPQYYNEIKKPSAYRVEIVPKLFLCAYIKSCFCPVFTCLKSFKK